MSALGHKQTFGPTRFYICYALISRHLPDFMTEDGGWDHAQTKRRRSHTNPENRGVPNLNLRDTHISLEKIFFHIFYFGALESYLWNNYRGQHCAGLFYLRGTLTVRRRVTLAHCLRCTTLYRIRHTRRHYLRGGDPEWGCKAPCLCATSL